MVNLERREDETLRAYDARVGKINRAVQLVVAITILLLVLLVHGVAVRCDHTGKDGSYSAC